MHMYKYYATIIIIVSLITPAIYLNAKIFNSTSKPFKKEKICTNIEDLYKVAILAHKKIRYLRNKKHVRAINSVLCPNKNAYIQETLKTLSFIINIIKEDRGKKIQRLHDPHFLNKHFKCVRWSGDRAQKPNMKRLPADTIHLTKYLTYLVPGSNHKTTMFSQALYALPKDEDGLSEVDVKQKKDSLLRFRYTRPEILAGALEQKKHAHLIKPLVWLRPQDASQAIMQGSVIVKMPGNTYKIFHVHRTNGHPYYRSYQNQNKNTQYWFFHQQKILQNLSKPLSHYLEPIKYVTLAGDISHIGLGRLIVLRYKDPKTKEVLIRLGVLVDTGGRFRRNFTTLDCFAGIFTSRNNFYRSIQHLPTHPEAFILIQKNPDTKH